VPVKVREIVRPNEADGWYLVATEESHRQARPEDTIATHAVVIEQADDGGSGA